MPQTTDIWTHGETTMNDYQECEIQEYLIAILKDAKMIDYQECETLKYLIAILKDAKRTGAGR